MIGRGHAVRGTTRHADLAAVIEAAGAEAVVADPDRVVTLASALAGITVVCVLLASAEASADALSALHGDRLAMLLTRVLDTPVRGLVYEASGSVDPVVLASGAELVSSFCSRSRIPFELLDSAAEAEWPAWAARAADAVDAVLTPP
jgi:uncharacterized protein YbjT (DUF2867 family)